ncbi:MAG: glycosyltransferase family 1 protein [Anaerotruncus sp.]|nr:glycosyltransferase family 1 protein [Anaerotruncus sp.]
MKKSIKQRNRICVYCDTWGQGGVETFIAETLTHMDCTDFEFRLICAEKQESHLDIRLSKHDLYMQPLLKGQGMSALQKTVCSIKPLLRFCRQEQISVLHFNIFHGVSLLQAAAARLCGVKHIIVHSHGAGLRDSSGLKIKLLGHYVFRWLFSWVATERWAASKEAAKFLFGNRNVQIIPNGVETSRFLFCKEIRHTLRQRLQAEKRLVLGCVGRIDTQKNQQFLLILLSILKQRGSNAMLLLIGDGEGRATLEKRVIEMGLKGDVVFLGISNRVNEWMCAMDQLLIPSLSEGLSIAAIEGQASGLAVLCSTGVPREVQLSELVCFLPLTSLEQWVHTVENPPVCNRTAMNIRISKSRYNITQSAVFIKSLYQKNCI